MIYRNNRYLQADISKISPSFRCCCKPQQSSMRARNDLELSMNDTFSLIRFIYFLIFEIIFRLASRLISSIQQLIQENALKFFAYIQGEGCRKPSRHFRGSKDRADGIYGYHHRLQNASIRAPLPVLPPPVPELQLFPLCPGSIDRSSCIIQSPL